MYFIRITYIGTSLWVEILKTPVWLFVILKEESHTITCLEPDGHPKHDGTEWLQGSGELILPTKFQMVGSSFTIYSREACKSLQSMNISNVIKIPISNFNNDFNFSEKMKDIISKKSKQQ